MVICSFYTPDEYYAGHAKELRAQLEELGVGYELLEVQKREGEDWADVTRRKIRFIKEICDKFPEHMVFWIDVDCRITHLPDYVSNSSADIIGFQRSFGSPLQIGYQNRSRFWEPSFWGVNATVQGRKLIADALELDERATIKATDDYFLEEAWRANAKKLTFQIIPATAIVRPRKLEEPGSRKSFFVFGSSGNVAEFKDKVVQHGAGKKPTLRGKLLKRAKRFEKALPESLKKPLRRIVDQVGITDLLTAGKARSVDPERSRMVGEMLAGSMKGDLALFEKAKTEFYSQYIPTYGQAATIEVSDSFAFYSTRPSEKKIALAWWTKPFPGNFGDWLSPLIISNYTDSRIMLQSPTRPTVQKHIFSLGSIGRFIKPNSIVLGTGVSSLDIDLEKKADYVSVRGPLTAQLLKQSGGPTVTSFGDPGVLMSEVFPLQRGATNGRVAFVRHFSHTALPMDLPENFDEFSVMKSRPADIEQFISTLIEYDQVLTSAMHVMITCQSYGIPCALVTFEGAEDNVHGTGIKYEDYALGAGVEVMNPSVVPLDLRKFDFQPLVRTILISDEKKSEVRTAVQAALSRFGS